jgi:gas vesicle protein
MRAWTFVAGVATGVGLGLLFAQQSGKDTRDFLQRKGQESLEEFASATRRASAQVRNAVSAGTERASQAVEAAGEAYRNTVTG